MKTITKTQLKNMIFREVKQHLKTKKNLKEGLAVDENEYFRLKDECKKDMERIYMLVRELEDNMYDDDAPVDPFELIEKIQNITDKWGR